MEQALSKYELFWRRWIFLFAFLTAPLLSNSPIEGTLASSGDLHQTFDEADDPGYQEESKA